MSSTAHLLCSSIYRMPYVEKGMSIGLFGGSFNPPHKGHLLVATSALIRLGLDQVWWMVTPGNPLKNPSILAPLEMRVAKSKELVVHPRIYVTAFEKKIHTHSHFSADTLTYILHYNPSVHFVWVMGVDSLVNFHCWHRWRWIVKTLPFVAIDRPRVSYKGISSLAAQSLARFRIAEGDAVRLAFQKVPAWILLHGRHVTISSTKLRRYS